jgi:CRP-like cAMP-binding protein
VPYRNSSSAAAFLQRGAWFGGLPAETQHAVLAAAHHRTFQAREVIQLQGDPGRGLTAVLHGSVSLARHVDDQTTALVHIAEPGFWFGQFSVLGIPTSISATARTSARVLQLGRPDFLRLARQHPNLETSINAVCHEYSEVMFRLAAEGRRMAPDVVVPTRLALMAQRRLLDLGLSAGPVTLAMTQAELGEMVGLARQQVNPRLKDLEAAGLITLRKGQVVVPEPSRLAQATSGRASRPRVGA